MSELFTVREAADRLRVSRSTLQRMRRTGQLGFVTVGTGRRRPRVRFTEEHLREFLIRAEHRPTALPSVRQPLR